MQFQFMFEYCNETRIEFSPDCMSLPNEESAIVIVNHRSSFDFYLIHALARRKNMLGYLKYFAKVQRPRDQAQASTLLYSALFGNGFCDYHCFLGF